MCRPFAGRDVMRAYDQLGGVEKIGPSSEASVASPASCNRRLMVFSGIGCASRIVDVRPVGLEPVRMRARYRLVDQAGCIWITVWFFRLYSDDSTQQAMRLINR